MTTNPANTSNADPDLSSPDFASGADYPPEVTEEEARAIVDMSRSIPAPIPNPEVNLDVPFIHQLWDTPDEFYGHWACGPTSTTMALAYYGVLEPKPITVNAPPGMAHESKFGWYISNAFSQNGRTFDQAAATPNGWGKGIYGAVVGKYCNGGWCAHASNIQSVLNHFLKPLGNSAHAVLKAEAQPERIKSILRDGHPVIASGKLFNCHHLIVIRGFYEDAGTTRWIINDPYSYRTIGKAYDGGNVVYDWNEINLKYIVWADGPHRG